MDNDESEMDAALTREAKPLFANFRSNNDFSALLDGIAELVIGKLPKRPPLSTERRQLRIQAEKLDGLVSRAEHSLGPSKLLLRKAVAFRNLAEVLLEEIDDTHAQGATERRQEASNIWDRAYTSLAKAVVDADTSELWSIMLGLVRLGYDEVALGSLLDCVEELSKRDKDQGGSTDRSADRAIGLLGRPQGVVSDAACCDQEPRPTSSAPQALAWKYAHKGADTETRADMFTALKTAHTFFHLFQAMSTSVEVETDDLLAVLALMQDEEPLDPGLSDWAKQTSRLKFFTNQPKGRRVVMTVITYKMGRPHPGDFEAWPTSAPTSAKGARDKGKEPIGVSKPELGKELGSLVVEYASCGRTSLPTSDSPSKEQRRQAKSGEEELDPYILFPLQDWVDLFQGSTEELLQPHLGGQVLVIDDVKQLVIPNQLVYARWQDLTAALTADEPHEVETYFRRTFRVPRDVLWNLPDKAPGGLLTVLKTLIGWELCDIDHSSWDAALCRWPGPGKPVEVTFSSSLDGLDDLFEQGFGLDPASISGSQRVLLHTDPSNLADHDVGSLPILPDDVLSDECLNTVSSWLRECSSSHENCGGDEEVPLPTRVIDVNPRGDPFLYSTARRPGQYIALSHCWGKEQLLTTTMATLHDRTSAIPLETLPKTFQDAVQVTRRLGIRYIWIDSLCIIQDSAEDWKKEAALMESVYSDALFTISADSASDSTKGLSCPSRHQLASCPIRETSPGLFVRRAPRKDHLGLCHRETTDDPNPRVHHDPLLQMAVQSQFAGTPSGAAHVDPAMQEKVGALNPLNTRAWTFQERMLSRRVLHYCETEMVWECDTATRCECESDPRPATTRSLRSSPRRRGSGGRHGLPADSGAMMMLDSYVAHGYSVGSDDSTGAALWSGAVEEYSTRQLTKFSDHLPALAGLAKKAAGLWSTTYLAGIWKEHLPGALSWWIRKGTNSARRAESGCPSWSWACLEGAVRAPWVMGPAMEQAFSESGIVVRHIEYQVDPVAPFSQPLVAYIGLTGLMVDVKVEERKCLISQVAGRPALRMSHPILSPDVSDWSEISEQDTYGLLQLVRFGGDEVRCLLLKETEEGCYQRVGHAVWMAGMELGGKEFLNLFAARSFRFV